MKQFKNFYCVDILGPLSLDLGPDEDLYVIEALTSIVCAAKWFCALVPGPWASPSSLVSAFTIKVPQSQDCCQMSTGGVASQKCHFYNLYEECLHACVLMTKQNVYIYVCI